MGFADSLKASSAKVMEDVNTKCYTIAKELFTRVIQLTPSPSNPGRYAEGLLANQWYPLETNFSDEVGTDLSDNGAASIDRVQSLTGKLFTKKDGTLTFANNLPYAYRAEVVGWPSHEGYNGGRNKETSGGYQNTGQPYRMVALSIQEIVAKYK